jgi:hypothetical protein
LREAIAVFLVVFAGVFAFIGRVVRRPYWDEPGSPFRDGMQSQKNDVKERAFLLAIPLIRILEHQPTQAHR